MSVIMQQCVAQINAAPTCQGHIGVTVIVDTNRNEMETAKVCVNCVCHSVCVCVA